METSWTARTATPNEPSLAPQMMYTSWLVRCTYRRMFGIGYGGQKTQSRRLCTRSRSSRILGLRTMQRPVGNFSSGLSGWRRADLLVSKVIFWKKYPIMRPLTSTFWHEAHPPDSWRLLLKTLIADFWDTLSHNAVPFTLPGHSASYCLSPVTIYLFCVFAVYPCLVSYDSAPRQQARSFHLFIIRPRFHLKVSDTNRHPRITTLSFLHLQ